MVCSRSPSPISGGFAHADVVQSSLTSTSAQMSISQTPDLPSPNSNHATAPSRSLWLLSIGSAAENTEVAALGQASTDAGLGTSIQHHAQVGDPSFYGLDRSSPKLSPFYPHPLSPGMTLTRLFLTQYYQPSAARWTLKCQQFLFRSADADCIVVSHVRIQSV